MTSNTAQPDTAHTLAAVVRLLSAAAEQAWAQAETDAPLSPRHLLGLGAHLAACQGLDLMPDPLPDPLLAHPAPGEVNAQQEPGDVGDVPLLLLRAAEQLARSVPIEALPAGASDLVISICDLVREATP